VVTSDTVGEAAGPESFRVRKDPLNLNWVMPAKGTAFGFPGPPFSIPPSVSGRKNDKRKGWFRAPPRNFDRYRTIKIRLNGEDRDVTGGTTVAGLLKELGIRREGVAVEVNRTVVRKADFDTHVVNERDEVEIVRFIGGG